MAMFKFGQWAVSVATVIVGVLLVFVIFIIVSTSPGHNDLYEQHEMLDQQQRVIICLILTPPDERNPESIAACQPPGD